MRFWLVSEVGVKVIGNGIKVRVMHFYFSYTMWNYDLI